MSSRRYRTPATDDEQDRADTTLFCCLVFLCIPFLIFSWIGWSLFLHVAPDANFVCLTGLSDCSDDSGSGGGGGGGSPFAPTVPGGGGGGLFPGPDQLDPHSHEVPGGGIECDPGYTLYWDPAHPIDAPTCQPNTPVPVAIDESKVADSIEPCSDYYRHMCYNWMRYAEPGEDASFGRVQGASEAVVHAIIDNDKVREWDSSELFATFYGSCIDAYSTAHNTEPPTDARGEQALAHLLLLVADSSKSIEYIAGYLAGRGFDGPLELGVEPKLPTDPTVRPLYIGQAGTLGVDPDVWRRNAFDDVTLVAHRHIMQTLFRSYDGTDAAWVDAADTVLVVEEMLARMQVESDAVTDDIVTYVDSGVFDDDLVSDGLASLGDDGWDWTAYLNGAGDAIDDDTFAAQAASMPAWLYRREFIEALDETRTAGTLSDAQWRTYFKGVVLYGMYQFMPSRFRSTFNGPSDDDEATVPLLDVLDFDALSIDTPAQHWRHARDIVDDARIGRSHHAPSSAGADHHRVSMVSGGSVLRDTPFANPSSYYDVHCETLAWLHLHEHVEQSYLALELKDEEVARVEAMTVNIRNAYTQHMIDSTRIDDAARNKLGQKLNAMIINVGRSPVPYPDYANDLSNVFDVQSFGHTALASMAYHASRRLAQVYAPATRLLPFAMPVFEANAYYDPLSNSINIPEGIMHAPFFDQRMTDASLYGTIGAIVAHEIGHGLATIGVDFDAQGSVDPWLTTHDAHLIEGEAQCFITQNTLQTVEFGTLTNGARTLEESVADTIGVRASLDALGRIVDLDAHPDKLREFFGAFAQMWCSRESAETEQARVDRDVHPLPELRVRAIAINMAEFAGAAYGCPVDSAIGQAVQSGRCGFW